MQSKTRSQVHLLINGLLHKISGDDAFLPLAQYLRYQAQLPGTKIVCAEGDCGACTVLVSRLENGSWNSLQTLNSCIAPIYLFDLCSIVTVEGLAIGEELNEVQQKMREFHGGQCGYCTPGMTCAMSGMAEACAKKGVAITDKKARNHLTGNLCRCTGYEPIIQAAIHVDLKKWPSLSLRYQTDSQAKSLKGLASDSLMIDGVNKKVFCTSTLAEATQIKSRESNVRIVAGATDLGVVHNKGKSFVDHALVLNKVPELQQIKSTDAGIFVGAQISLTDFENFIENKIPEFNRLLRIFASPQIKNQGTLLGNVLNGSPIGDTLPPLLALNAELHLTSVRGDRTILLTNFYKAYKTFDIAADEIVTGIFIPAHTGQWVMKFYKVSLRKDLDISAVTFAAVLKMKNNLVTEARFALGGVGPTVFRLPNIENDFIGKSLSPEIFSAAGKKARSMIKPLTDLRATEQYRLQVTENLFMKCYAESSCL